MQRFDIYEDEEHLIPMGYECCRVYTSDKGNWCLSGDARRVEKELEKAQHDLAYAKSDCLKHADDAQLAKLEVARLKRQIKETEERQGV